MPRRAPLSLRGAGILLLLATACAQILGVDDVVIAPLGAGGAASPAPPPPPACQPRELRCQGAALQICRDDQQGFRTARICSTPELCCDDEARCPADLGCQPPACAVGEFRCDGALLSVCNDAQTGWAQVTSCPSAAQCNTTLGRCSDQPCSATLPDRQCSEGALLECRGGDWSPVTQCESSALCSSVGPTLGCLPTNCTDVRGVGESDLPSPFKCDNGELLRCNDRRAEWEFVETCINPLHCNDLSNVLGDVQAAHLPVTELENLGCTPPGCTPGKFRCDGSRLLLCNADRTAYNTLVQDCGSAGRCNASLGTCTAQECTVGTTQCSGNEYQVCTAERTWQRQEICSGGAQCALSGCVPATCEVTEYRCNGAALERCNVNGTAWIPIHTCETEALCNDGAKRCDPPLCRDGELRCSRDGKLERCSAGRDAWDISGDCRELAQLAADTPPERVAASCDLSGEGRCNPTPSCVTGSVRCSGQYLERCASDTWQPVERCASNAACDAVGGTCRPRACRPGEHRCVTPGATPRVAEAGEQTQGLTLQVCEEAGTGFVNVRDCPADNQCDARHGQCDLCRPLDPLCFAGSLYRCSADGQERELEKACSSGCVQPPSSEPRPSDRASCQEDLAAP
ncbi:MAG: hypothetical protein RL033_3022 [Pseudomonadota bacterium]|jgi:hypothetical protein